MSSSAAKTNTAGIRTSQTRPPFSRVLGLRGACSHNASFNIIRTVAAGDALLSPAVTKRVIRQFARSSRPEPPKGLDELTAREWEIFRLIANGLSNAEIAQELYISDTTVKTQVTHVFQKLNLRDRVQAVVLAYQTGLFETDSTGPGAPEQSPAPELPEYDRRS